MTNLEAIRRLHRRRLEAAERNQPVPRRRVEPITSPLQPCPAIEDFLAWRDAWSEGQRATASAALARLERWVTGETTDDGQAEADPSATSTLANRRLAR
jgi:hypothetical protein